MGLLIMGLPLVLTGCVPSGDRTAEQSRAKLRVVTTTGILADLVRNVGGDRVAVHSLVPDGADPHSYEPTLRDIRQVAYADVAFSNYLLLEEHGIIKALDANLPAGSPSISLAEGAVKYAAEIIPLVENVSLDTVWLGMRVRGSGAESGATRSSEVRISATALEGPPDGQLVTYLTESFGRPTFYVDSTNGFDPGNGYRSDTATLPTDAHSHMSWAFTRPGYYQLHVKASLITTGGAKPKESGEATIRFAVGVDPHALPDTRTVLSAGHADVTADLDRRQLYLFADPHGGGDLHLRVFDPATTVIEVPNRALHEIPADPAYRFLGRAGEQIFQLPQAVLGKHVHGEIDPHLWHDVRNVEAYVKLIRDVLADQDPAGTGSYRANADSYLRQLDELDRQVRETIETIPPARRQLVTTHDAFAYLGEAYGLEIAGFVTPNPSTEPSLADRRKLNETIRNLHIPAVFLEPNLATRSTTLREVAAENGVRVCPIYGDAFDAQVRTYVDLMRFNADSLATCLS